MSAAPTPGLKEATEAARRIREYWRSDYNREDEIIVARFVLSLASKAEDGWRPIKEASENHLPVLAWSLETGLVVAFRDVAWNWWPCPASYPLTHTPTHFRLLPAPPKQPTPAPVSREEE